MEALIKVLNWLGVLQYKVMLDTEILKLPRTDLGNGMFQYECMFVTNFRYPWAYSVHEGKISFSREGGRGSVEITDVNAWFEVP
jgi:hypothetical protein